MNWLTNLFSGLGNLFGGGNQGYSSNAGNVAQSMGNYGVGSGTGQGSAQAMSGGGQGGGVMSSFSNPNTMAGLGIMGLGQLMNKTQKMPDFNSNPAVQQLNQWNSQANHPMDPNVAQAMQNTLGINNEQQLRNLRDVYKNLRPGTDYTTDSNYQRDLGNLNRSIDTNNADAMAGAQFQSNNQQLGNLNNMAQLQVGSQMGQAGMNAARQQQQNQMFGDVGSMFLQKGIGMPDYMSMFKRGQ